MGIGAHPVGLLYPWTTAPHCLNHTILFSAVTTSHMGQLTFICMNES